MIALFVINPCLADKLVKLLKQLSPSLIHRLSPLFVLQVTKAVQRSGNEASSHLKAIGGTKTMLNTRVVPPSPCSALLPSSLIPVDCSTRAATLSSEQVSPYR